MNYVGLAATYVLCLGGPVVAGLIRNRRTDRKEKP